jgi:predicted anti-sigma-YlaC factor YlaD
MNGDCDRARQWSSTELDGELSTFELVLLRAHLASCPSCRDFRSSIGGLTGELRAAPLEQLENVIEIGHLRRRRLRLRLAPAAAAVAVAVVGLGSILASSAVRSGPVANGPARAPVVSGELAALDTMNLSTSKGRERLDNIRQTRVATQRRSLRGGPVTWQR